MLEGKVKVEQSGAKVEVVEEADRKKLRPALKDFLKGVEARGSMVAHDKYEFAANEFLEMTGVVYVDELKKQHVQTYLTRLRKAGDNGDRTISNKWSNLKAFFLSLKAFDKDGMKELMGLEPQYEEGLPEIYTPDDIGALFEAVRTPPRGKSGPTIQVDPETMVASYSTMLGVGLRDREAVYIERAMFDLRHGVTRVRKNDLYGFKVKDHEQRDIPMESELVERMSAYFHKHPDRRLAFGTMQNTPNGHMLRHLKRIVHHAGLNCGHCEACLSPTPATGRDGGCSYWYLHRFRQTCITMWLRPQELGGAGLDLRTVMTFSGHADLEPILRYLRPAEAPSVRSSINNVKWKI